MSSNYDGTSGITGSILTGEKIDRISLWHGTSNPTAGSNDIPTNGLFLNVSSNILYENTGTLASPTWTVRLSQISYNDILPYLSLSTTIGDYSSPASAVASSEATGTTTTVFDSVGTSNSYIIRGSPSRVAEKVTNTNMRSKAVTQLKVNLKKLGSPTGNINAYIRKTSDDSIVSTANETLTAASVPATSTQYTFTFTSAISPNEDFRLSIELSGYGGSPPSDYIEVISNATNPSTHGVLSDYAAGWTDVAGSDVRMEFTHDTTFTASNTVDADVVSYWKSNSEANPNIYADLTSVREIVGIALNINKTLTTITSLKIRASTDTTFTDSENIAYVNISDFTDDTWRFLANNFLADNRRYVQIYANETGVLSINEVKVRYGVSDALKILNHRHRTRTVDSADSFIDSN